MARRRSRGEGVGRPATAGAALRRLIEVIAEQVLERVRSEIPDRESLRRIERQVRRLDRRVEETVAFHHNRVTHIQLFTGITFRVAVAADLYHLLTLGFPRLLSKPDHINRLHRVKACRGLSRTDLKIPGSRV